MKKWKVMSLSLAVLMTTTMLSACGPAATTGTVSTTVDVTVEGGETQNNNQSGGQGTQSGGSGGTNSQSGQGGSTSRPSTVNEEEVRKELEGYTFTIASGWMTDRDDIGENTPFYERLFWERAEEIEKEYGCKIEMIRFYGRTNDMRTYIMAGKKIADVVESMPIWIPENVAAGYLRPWSDVPDINTGDTSKWLSYTTNVSTYKGQVYGIQFMKPAEARLCVMFNKTLLDRNGVDVNGIYDLVKNKQWTWDKLREYAQMATKDTNNDGVMDTWGIIGKYDYIANGILPSFGGSLITQSGGKYAYSLNSSASVAALDFYNRLVNTDKVVWVADQLYGENSYTNLNEQTYVQRFNSGNSAFLIWDSWVLNQYTKANANFEYGILPLPLGGSMKEYVSPAHTMRTFCITSTNDDLDKVAIVMNAFADNFGGYQSDTDWYEDVKADYFKNDADKNMEMYELILNSSMIDYGLAIENLETAFNHDVVLNSIYWKKSTPSVAADSIKNQYTDLIDNVFNK